MSDEWATITPTKGEQKEEVEFEIEGQEEDNEQLQLELEDNKTEDKELPKKIKAQEEASESEEQKALEGVETSGAQKRIRQLVQQKKEREAEIEKLIEENKKVQMRLQEREEEYKNLLNTNTETNERQVQERLELARNAYKNALESGDTDQIIKAQEILTNAQQDNSKIADFKKELEKYNSSTKQEIEEQLNKPSSKYSKIAERKAYAWANQNDWFNQDRILTAAALEFDNQVQEEGYDPEDDDYYEEIDRRMAEQFPQKFSQPVQQEAENPRPKATSSPSQVVAGASLSPKASSGKKVKLTQEDVRLAQKWGISLEQYAAEKLKIESAEEGAYTTIR